MIDREKRDVAATLVRQFRDGEITSDDLETDWPTRSDDKVLEAVESVVWSFYDDHRPRRMIGRDAASPKEREDLTRYAAFLESQLPYDWSKSNFYGLGGCGVLVILSFGLLWPVDWWIKRGNARIEAELRQEGDLDVWPFTSRADYDRSPLNTDVRFPPIAEIGRQPMSSNWERNSTAFGHELLPPVPGCHGHAPKAPSGDTSQGFRPSAR